MQGAEASVFPLMFSLVWGLFSGNFCYCLCREGRVGILESGETCIKVSRICQKTKQNTKTTKSK